MAEPSLPRGNKENGGTNRSSPSPSPRRRHRLDNSFFSPRRSSVASSPPIGSRAPVQTPVKRAQTSARPPATTPRRRRIHPVSGNGANGDSKKRLDMKPLSQPDPVDDSQRPMSGKSSAEVQEVVFETVVGDNGHITYIEYAKGKFLGKGGFARVFEMTRVDTGQVYAAKVVPKASLAKPKAKEKFTTEIKIHKTLSHPNVVHFDHFFDDEENSYILLELCKCQSMADLIRRRKRISEPELRYYLHQILVGVQYLHSQLVLHRDLKLGNLFVHDGMQVKIGDFGLAVRLDSILDRKTTMCGTPNYIAPEILAGQKGDGHSFEADVWSIGVVIYTLLIGKPPFETKEVKDTYKRIKAVDYSFPHDIPISDEAEQLIRSILQVDPAKRPTLEDLLSSDFMHGTMPASLPKSALLYTPSSCRVTTDRKQPPVQRPKTPEAPKANVPVKESLLHVCRYLEQVYESRVTAEVVDMDKATLWLSSWVDYTTKYGMGYTLTNGAAGVYFNDSTKMISTPDMKAFEYIERGSSALEAKRCRYQMRVYDPSLTKKVTIMNHFRNYLVDGKDSDGHDRLRVHLGKRPAPEDESLTFVTKWVKTKHAVVFCLSNGSFQTNFHDHSRLLILNDGRTVNFLDRDGDFIVKATYDAVHGGDRKDLMKRLRYTRDTLQQILDSTR